MRKKKENKKDEKFAVPTLGHGHNSFLKQPKLLLTTVWPTVRFQQLDSIRGFLKGGRPDPHCMSHTRKLQLDQELHKKKLYKIQKKKKKKNQGQTLT